jgi:hypothetical protein
MVHEWRRGEYSISTDKGRLDVAVIHGFLTMSYWAAGVPMVVVKRSIEHSPKADIGSFVAQVLATSSIVPKETLKRTNIQAHIEPTPALPGFSVPSTLCVRHLLRTLHKTPMDEFRPDLIRFIHCFHNIFDDAVVRR